MALRAEAQTTCHVFAVTAKLELNFSAGNRRNEHFGDVARVVRIKQNARCLSFAKL